MKTKRYLGQHFLTSSKVKEKIVEVIRKNLKDEALLIEIGCGEGAITSQIFQISPRYLGIEVDERLFTLLKEKFPSATFVNQDATVFEIDKISENFVAVGNLPYYAAKEIIFNFLKKPSKVFSAHFLLQYEFALKLISKPKEKYFSKYSVWVQSFYEVKKEFEVAPSSFKPSPKVKSSFVSFYPKRREEENTIEFFKWVERLFLRRRKVFLSNFRNGIRTTVYKILNKYRISNMIRCEEINPEIYLEIYKEIKSKVGDLIEIN